MDAKVMERQIIGETNQAQWINQQDASFIHDLRREFIFDNNGTFV